VERRAVAMAESVRRRAAWWQSLGLALIVSVGVLSHADVPAEGQSRATPRGSATSAGSAEAKADEVDAKKLEAKLDQILQSQERIFQRLDEVMEELRIVKVRATLR
jgi:hypothetical protein